MFFGYSWSRVAMSVINGLSSFGRLAAAVAALLLLSHGSSAFTLSRRHIAGPRSSISLVAARASDASAPASAIRPRQSTVTTPSSASSGTGILGLGLCGLVVAGAASRRRGRRRSSRQKAYTSAAQTYEGAPIGPPPDLPSLLLKNRIVYVGAPITNDLAELVIAQLLYLNYESSDKPVTMYINSSGSTLKNNTRYIGERKVGMETDAFAIADCMQYIKPQVMTICIGQAYGTAAMLLGLGAKGKRFALPNATIMLSEPREPPVPGPRQASDLKIMAKEVLQNRSTMAELLAKATDKAPEQVLNDTQRCYYMTPSEAVEYNLIDKMLSPDKLKQQANQELPSFVRAL